MRTPYLNEGEKIISQVQGSLQHQDSWRLGYLFLTNRRIIFLQVTKQIFEAKLDEVMDLSIVKRAWLFGVRVRQLSISLSSEIRGKKTYIALAEPEKWNNKIKESMSLMLVERWGYNGANPEPPSDT